GYQLLDGKKFLHYVRNRGDAQGGDLGRAGRQQEMMIVLLDQITKPRGLIRAPALYRAITDSVEMDLHNFQLAALGLFGLRVNPSEIESHVLGGRGQLSYRDGRNIYYLVTDEDHRVEVIERVFGLKVDHRAIPTLQGPVVEEEPEEPEPDPEIESGVEADPEPELEPEEESDPEQKDPVEEDPDEDPVDENRETEENGETEKEPGEEESLEKEEKEEPADGEPADIDEDDYEID
ncbi:MAG: LCP family protein, partial [Bacillota bacterium]